METMRYILRIDGKGRITIPSDVRRAIGVGRFVELSIEGRRIVLKPIEDPLEELSKLVVKVHVKASKEPEKLSKIAYNQLLKEGVKR